MRASTAAPLPLGLFGEHRCGTPRKKHKKLTPEPKKNRPPGRSGGGLGGDLGHLGSKLRLEAALAIFGRPWKGQDGAKTGPKGTKMNQVGAKFAGSCGQEAPRWPKREPRWPSGGPLGSYLGHFSKSWERSLQRSPKYKIEQSYNGFG